MKVEQMLRSHFNATESKSMSSNGVTVTSWNIGPRTVVTLKDTGTGAQCVLLPPIVSSEKELIQMIKDNLKGGYRVTAPLKLVEQKKGK
jgi:hypothetical protein